MTLGDVAKTWLSFPWWKNAPARKIYNLYHRDLVILNQENFLPTKYFYAIKFMDITALYVKFALSGDNRFPKKEYESNANTSSM